MSTNDTNDTGSALALRSVALPAFTNAHGDIFGGWLLSQMDLAGGTVATRLAEGRIVTVAVTEMSFQRPVFVGDEITCFADVVKIGRSSITLKISVFARRGHAGEDIKVTEGLFTYVAVDAEGKSRPVQAHVATRTGGLTNERDGPCVQNNRSFRRVGDDVFGAVPGASPACAGSTGGRRRRSGQAADHGDQRVPGTHRGNQSRQRRCPCDGLPGKAVLYRGSGGVGQ